MTGNMEGNGLKNSRGLEFRPMQEILVVIRVLLQNKLEVQKKVSDEHQLKGSQQANRVKEPKMHSNDSLHRGRTVYSQG